MAELMSISTIVKHDTITIVSKLHPKGKRYEFRNQNDFGAIEWGVLLALEAEAKQYANVKRMTAAQTRRLDDIKGELVKLILPKLEPSVFAALTVELKEMVWLNWASNLMNSAGAAEGNVQSRRTTSASARGSKRSTAATRKRGSTSRTGS